MLSRGINRFPKVLFAEALIARGQIFLFQAEYDKALLDFRAVASAMPSDALANLGLGDVYKGLKEYNKAIHFFSKAIKAGQSKVGRQKRALLYMQM